VQLHDLIEMEGISLKREMRTLHETSLNAARALEAEVEMLRDSIAEAAEENLQMATARVELRALERQAEIYRSSQRNLSAPPERSGTDPDLSGHERTRPFRGGCSGGPLRTAQIRDHGSDAGSGCRDRQRRSLAQGT
jgi:hypothetical protein